MSHVEPFVRSSALVATSELLRALPPPTLAGALLRGDDAQSDGLQPLGVAAPRSAESDALLPERLQRLHSALQAELESCGGDDTRRALTGGCLALQAQLAEGATAAMESAAAESAANALSGSSLARSAIMLPPW